MSPSTLLLIGALFAPPAAPAPPAQAARPAAPPAKTLVDVAGAGKSRIERFEVDPVHSMALFRIHHLGAGLFYGRFNDVRGHFEFGGPKSTQPVFDVSIAIDSVDTGSDALDGHLKSPDFFDAEQYAHMTFRSAAARQVGKGRYEVTGTLALHGVTQDVTAQLEWTGLADFGRGRRCGFEAIFTIRRSDFGIKYGIEGGALGDEVKVIVALEGVARPAAPPEGKAAGEPGLPERLAAHDTNGDGKLQRDEAPEGLLPLFERLDTNQDGAIDAAEFAAMRRGGDRGQDS
ncbi:MAG: YceI family protein [Planctomycetota bacterium]|jgi:polyisoprenoid-binding protein YceI